MKVTKILCAIDPSDRTPLVPEAAISVAAQHQSGITFISVIPEVASGASPTMGWGMPGTGRHLTVSKDLDARAEREKAVVEELRQWTVAASKVTRGEVSIEVSHGQPADMLIMHAQSGEYDLVVLGGGGKPGLLSALLGSISYKVVRNSTCSVLMVRPPPS